MSGITISVDSGTTFESGAAQYVAVAKLDANTFIVAYQDNDDSNKGKAVVGTRVGTTITVSSADIATFSTNEVSFIDVAVLSTSLIVISYYDGTSVVSKVIAGTISGTTITFGTAVTSLAFPSNSATTVCFIDSTNFVTSVTYSGAALSYVGSVSGTTITLGSAQTAASGSVTRSFASSDNLNSTDFVFTFISGSQLKAIVGVVNTAAQTISFGAIVNIEVSMDVTKNQVSAFDGLHFICFYTTAIDNYIRACSINDTTHAITSGTRIDDTTNISNIAICTIDSTHFLVSYCDTDDSNKGKVRAGSLSGATTLAWDAEGSQTFDTATITYMGVCNLDGEFFLVGFKHT
jgi:hypothetical protein